MRHWNSHTWFALFATVSLLGGCRKPPPPSEANEEPNRQKPAPVAAPVPPPSLAEGREFGQQLQVAIRTKNYETTARLYGLNRVIERLLRSLSLTEAELQQLMQMAKLSSGGFSARMVNDVAKGGTCTALGVRIVDGKTRVLVRFLSEDGGLNYHEFRLVRYPDGTVAPEDILIVATGEMYSQLFDRIMLQGLVAANPELRAKLVLGGQAHLDKMSAAVKIMRATQQGRHQDALAIYRQLPVESQNDKVILFYTVPAAAEVSDEEHIRVVERYRQHFPKCPSLDLLLLDYHIVKKEYDQYFQCLARLENEIGGDPYLYYMRGNALEMMGRIAEAKVAFERAIEQEPTMDFACWGRLALALKETNHADTLVWLKKLVEQCAYPLDLESLAADKKYAKFVKSPQYTDLVKWMQMRKS